MIKFKSLGISMVACTAFAAASCMAQTIDQPEPSYAPGYLPALPAPLSHATQLKRCQDFGRYVNLVASARDAGESETHLTQRLGLTGQGVRLPRHVLATGGTALVRQIYAKNASPGDWQIAMTGVCEKNIVS